MKTTGEIIKELRESRGMTQQQLASLMGMKTYTTITKWESGDNFPKGRDIKLLSEYFKVSSDYILGIQDEVDQTIKVSEYPHIPIGVSAGMPIEVDGIADVETISIPDSIMGKWAGDRDIFIMHVNGESMNKVMPHGSLIAVKPIERPHLKDRDIVVYSDGYEYAVKRFYLHHDELIFRPDSDSLDFREYRASINNAELQIHGKVVLYIVELE
ncbi:hypothetical protein BEP19_16050 [Ammoniphilus oxalaticus]|uniref:HTH cro/C1-type domain-containing protein n=1 Tax=Ammoniphilus oxalaticus TaxID=66863 RepID=A0A419SQN4_9BACL|nr:XRE family transcriptional regulator [Ammoniphilus oxalaticus]RKD26715.1 hypothetical protein BEP19_16050 [Ammoniphilus oxalaticus]